MERNNILQAVNIRLAKPGEASYISYLHMKVYQELYQFRPIFEYYLLKGLSEFLHNSAGSELWVTEAEGKIVGSIAVVKSDEKGTAQLRWFVLDSQYQGLGIGRKLMQTALQFCKGAGYKRVFLWTVDILKAARHIYSSNGFQLTGEKANDEWADKTIIEERWELWL